LLFRRTAAFTRLLDLAHSCRSLCHPARQCSRPGKVRLDVCEFGLYTSTRHETSVHFARSFHSFYSRLRLIVLIKFVSYRLSLSCFVTEIKINLRRLLALRAGDHQLHQIAWFFRWSSAFDFSDQFCRLDHVNSLLRC
jgi:hypothetical protein